MHEKLRHSMDSSFTFPKINKNLKERKRSWAVQDLPAIKHSQSSPIFRYFFPVDVIQLYKFHWTSNNDCNFNVLNKSD